MPLGVLPGPYLGDNEDGFEKLLIVMIMFILLFYFFSYWLCTGKKQRSCWCGKCKII